MILHWNVIDNRISQASVDKIVANIEYAFDLENTGEIAINNSKFFKYTETGKFNRIVVNQAPFLSKGFQNRLAQKNWVLEKTLLDQTIDAYIELSQINTPITKITKDDFISVLNEIVLDDENFLNYTNDFYKNFFTRTCFVSNNNHLSSFTTTVPDEHKLKIGLEFETGNVASSFRAISKLNYLYNNYSIDAGVFITSKDKFVSTNIWPSSNRNGSIEELENRNFLDSIQFPLILVGFEPDKWDKETLFLKKDGTRYSMSDEVDKVIIDNREFIHYLKEDYYMLVE